jgi:hypothetical protein
VYTASALEGGHIYIFGTTAPHGDGAWNRYDHESQGFGQENLQELQNHQALWSPSRDLRDRET